MVLQGFSHGSCLMQLALVLTSRIAQSQQQLMLQGEEVVLLVELGGLLVVYMPFSCGHRWTQSIGLGSLARCVGCLPNH